MTGEKNVPINIFRCITATLKYQDFGLSKLFFFFILICSFYILGLSSMVVSKTLRRLFYNVKLRYKIRSTSVSNQVNVFLCTGGQKFLFHWSTRSSLDQLKSCCRTWSSGLFVKILTKIIIIQGSFQLKVSHFLVCLSHTLRKAFSGFVPDITSDILKNSFHLSISHIHASPLLQLYIMYHSDNSYQI